LSAVDRRLSESFPAYSELVIPASSDVKTIQAALRRDEVLVFVLTTKALGPLPEETFIWFLSSSDIRWSRSDLGPEALTREIAALRCGVDYAAWKPASGAGCDKLTGSVYTAEDRAAKRPLPFDSRRAYRLYASLFGQDADFIRDKKLLLVPTGALTQLPLQLLLTKPPTGDDYRAMAWLPRQNALSILPTVSSLISLRRLAAPSKALLPLAGFGNPILDGKPNDPKFGAVYRERSRAAREKQVCSTSAGAVGVPADGPREVAILPKQRDRLADLGQLRTQAPLPETADELCDVARQLDANPRDILLGSRATERQVKKMSASGELANYRIVYFATHGVLPGRLRGSSEPGLILTPPEVASDEDDGYLSVSEIEGLKLDADWVILSACNTAAGGVEVDEALAGLARAFFYAQARSLLVSHWAVNSDATVRLLIAAIREIVQDRSIGRAEALRRAMMGFMKAGQSYEAHPEFWAPFALIGY
jgi:CHAT domain-containing protein